MNEPILAFPKTGELTLVCAGDDWLRQHLVPEDLLDAREKARADRILSKEVARRFAYARSFLRLALGQALDERPQDLSFGTGIQGKPFLAGRHWGSGLFFNLSHCQGLTALVTAKETLVGVDAETPDRDLDHQRFAQRFFHRDELAVLADLKGEDQRQAFYRIWTQKEAWLKAMGVGLKLSLSSFAVSGGDGEKSALLFWDQDREAQTKWRFETLSIRGLPVTVCADAGPWRLVLKKLF